MEEGNEQLKINLVCAWCSSRVINGETSNQPLQKKKKISHTICESCKKDYFSNKK